MKSSYFIALALFIATIAGVSADTIEQTAGTTQWNQVPRNGHPIIISTQLWGQNFLISGSGTYPVHSFALQINRTGSLETGKTFRAVIYQANGSGFPSGSPILTSNVLDPSSVPINSAAQWFNLTFNNTANLSYGTWYVIAITYDGGSTPSFRTIYNDAGGYAGGHFVWKSDGGGWTEVTGDDLNFILTYGELIPPELTINAVDAYDSTPIMTFNATVVWNGSTVNYSTTNGTIITTAIVNSSLPANVTVSSFGFYDNVSLGVVNSSLSVGLSRWFFLGSPSFSGNFSYNGTNYVRNLSFSLNVSCVSGSSMSVFLFVDSVANSSSSVVCDDSLKVFSGVYVHSSEGFFNLSFGFNNSLSSSLNYNSSSTTFVSDLFAGVVSLSISRGNGFGSGVNSVNVSLVCTDFVSPIVTYNLSFNGVGLYFANKTANSTQTNSSVLVNGVNNLTGVCTDFFGSSSSSLSEDVYFVSLYLIDEQTNTAFDVANISRARVYLDDNSSFYQFGGSNGSAVNFTGDDSKLRFELVYASGDIITRYVDVSLVDSPVRVCANRDGVSHYEQLIISAQPQASVLNSIFANCLVSADYTRFAYQDAFVLKAFTIATQYYLYTFDGFLQVLLASLDGSIASFINLDTIEFASSELTASIAGSALSFQGLSNSTVVIGYLNLANNTDSSEVVIYRVDTGETVFSYSDFVDPDSWTLYFDYSSLVPVVNSSTLFRLVMTSVVGGEESSVSRYFTPGGSSGVWSPGWAAVASVMVVFLSLSMVAARLTFGWFGFFGVFIGVVLLSLAPLMYYSRVLLVVEVIILVYIGVVAWGNANRVGGFV